MHGCLLRGHITHETKQPDLTTELSAVTNALEAMSQQEEVAAPAAQPKVEQNKMEDKERHPSGTETAGDAASVRQSSFHRPLAAPVAQQGKTHQC